MHRSRTPLAAVIEFEHPHLSLNSRTSLNTVSLIFVAMFYTIRFMCRHQSLVSHNAVTIEVTSIANSSCLKG